MIAKNEIITVFPSPVGICSINPLFFSLYNNNKTAIICIFLGSYLKIYLFARIITGINSL